MFSFRPKGSENRVWTSGYFYSAGYVDMMPKNRAIIYGHKGSTFYAQLENNPPYPLNSHQAVMYAFWSKQLMRAHADLCIAGISIHVNGRIMIGKWTIDYDSIYYESERINPITAFTRVMNSIIAWSAKTDRYNLRLLTIVALSMAINGTHCEW